MNKPTTHRCRKSAISATNPEIIREVRAEEYGHVKINSDKYSGCGTNNDSEPRPKPASFPQEKEQRIAYCQENYKNENGINNNKT
jgi:hypothetical protein